MAPGGRRVLVSTVGHPIATESAVFPLDGNGNVASAMHLYKTKHRPEDDLDSEHSALVAAVEAGEITLEEREATQEEGEEALADFLMLARMRPDRAMDDWDA